MEDAKKFTHLHVHTEYSLLDGSCKIKELILRTKQLGMEHIAITDHGVMFGVIDFYKEAKKNGIKPILGCEVYVASKNRLDKESSHGNFYYHLILLAENMEGYKNLIKLVSIGFTEGFYYKPRVDLETLKKYHAGLIALSACLAGPVARNILRVSYDKAKETAILYDNIFGRDNFYLELQDHGISEQREVNQQLIRMSGETGIPLVCTNDIHYVNKEDSEAHDILICIQTAKTVSEINRMRYEGSEFYLKSIEEMYALFPYAKQALENTYKIAKRCDVNITFNEYKLPKYGVSDNYEYLRNLCISGLEKRYGEITDELNERLNMELETINSMGFIDYFLIVWDFIKYANDNGIIVGPGRGSAAGSLVAYSLNITSVDPIRFNLLFERFLNPERISMPDIDIDFCYERRQEVIDYVIEKYGANHVAQIITFGTMAARNSIRDVGRALAMSYGDVDRIAKMIPFEIGMTIEKALQINPELMSEYKADGDVKYLLDMSMRLEGLPRHASTHAAGVVISDKPVVEYVPLNSNDGVITTQFPMNTLEELGLLKMDFLGLRTLTVIQNTVNEIKRNHNLSIDISKIDFSDPDVFKLMASAKTEGVFQLESTGMKHFMKELKPKSIEDIIAGVALYRPGPMDFIPKYIKGKNSRDKIKFTHPKLEPILNTTYGCIVYQEQVMQIFRELAGYSLGRSDLVRRAMSKKKSDVLNQEREYFINGLDNEIPGCLKNGISKEAATKIFDEMADFAKYAFNKSHAAAYAIVAYQTAWLKRYYPIEFMAALLTSVMDSSSKVSEYINECKNMGITLLPPDINEGFAHFSVSGGKIRFGLAAIKNVGKGNIAAIVKEREQGGAYTTLYRFLERLYGELNTRCIESLIKAGALDSLHGKRSQYMLAYKQIYSDIIGRKKRNIEGQISLFELTGSELAESNPTDKLPDKEEYDLNTLLSMEKEVLGIYLSGHPLSKYEKLLGKYTSATSAEFAVGEEGENDGGDTVTDGKKVIIGGIITAKTVKYTKNNKVMAFITVEDVYGLVEVIVFPNVYAQYSGILEEDVVVLVEGHVSVGDDNIKLIAEKIKTYDSLKTLWLKINEDSTETVSSVTKFLCNYKGNTPVIIYNQSEDRRYRTDENNWVLVNERLFNDLKDLLGDDAVVLKE